MRYYILALISALMLSGCGLVEDSGKDCPTPPTEPSDDIMLSFQMISSNIGTRTDNFTGHVETDSDWPQFEDLIDINDFAFYIFLDNATSNQPLIMRMTDIAGSTDPNQMITGAYGAYTVTTVIPKKNLEAHLGYELSPNTTNPVDFRVVLLANMNSGRGDGTTVDYNLLAPTDAITAGDDLSSVTTFQQFMDNANALGYNLNYLYSGNQGDSQVSGRYKGAIPMFGMITCRTTEDQLFQSRPEERINMGDVYMLRSLAKIRVIDNSDKNDDGYPYITSVDVSSATNMLRPLPANASTYANGYQVHAANIMSASASNNNRTFGLGTLGMTQNAKGTTRFGYIPEQAIEYGYPTINITARLDAERTETYSIPMQGNQEEFPGFNGFTGNILRNHIYTLSVNNIAVGTPTEITVNVEPWTESSFTLDYTESILVSDPLDWTPGSYENTGENSSVIIMKPWVTTESGSTWVPLVGTFGFQSPIGARWNAYLLTTEGDEDAFAFIDEVNLDEYGNPSIVPSVSGIIDGKTLSTLKIITMDPDPAQQNRARLQILVTIGEGASATVTEAEVYGSIEYYTIVQNPL